MWLASSLNKQLLEVAKRSATDCSWSAIYHVLNRNGMDMQMNYCLKIFASHLRQSGIEAEIVDLLQGRVPKSVFVRHYFRPSLDYRAKVLYALDTLRSTGESSALIFSNYLCLFYLANLLSCFAMSTTLSKPNPTNANIMCSTPISLIL